MSPPSPSSRLEQTIRLLRDGIIARRWAGALPGVQPLARELGTSAATLNRALKQLEQEGLIDPMGAGRRRKVSSQTPSPVKRETPRIGLLLDVDLPTQPDNVRMFLHDLMHALEEANHVPFIAAQSMHALHQKSQAIRALMKSSAADLWLVYRPEYLILENLAAEFPRLIMAIGGRCIGLNVASSGTDKVGTMRETVERLTALGHKRIVLALPPVSRKPQPGAVVRSFNDALAAAGIPPGPYHVPDWEYTPAGYEKLLQSLFSLTPPTALIMEHAGQYMATLSFFAMHGISPQQMSLVVCESNSAFDWTFPRPSYMASDDDLLILDALNWIEARLDGSTDRPQHLHSARLIPGDTFKSPPRKDAGKRR